EPVAARRSAALVYAMRSPPKKEPASAAHRQRATYASTPPNATSPKRNQDGAARPAAAVAVRSVMRPMLAVRGIGPPSSDGPPRGGTRRPAAQAYRPGATRIEPSSSA